MKLKHKNKTKRNICWLIHHCSLKLQNFNEAGPHSFMTSFASNLSLLMIVVFEQFAAIDHRILTTGTNWQFVFHSKVATSCTGCFPLSFFII